MINWSRVRALREEVGTEDFDEIVDLFLEEVQEVIERLASAPDMTLLEDDMHFLKGCALSLGFDVFSDLCQSGEKVSMQGSAADVDLPAILQCYADSKRLFLADMPTSLAG